MITDKELIERYYQGFNDTDILFKAYIFGYMDTQDNDKLTEEEILKKIKG